MKNNDCYSIEIEIDRLTNSIVNKLSGESFQTEVNPANKNDLLYVDKKYG
ncbi:hypothetical protein [Pedobacter sp. L105]|nr:hypothetical protein [Pedobacter sp. L105]